MKRVWLAAFLFFPACRYERPATTEEILAAQKATPPNQQLYLNVSLDKAMGAVKDVLKKESYFFKRMDSHAGLIEALLDKVDTQKNLTRYIVTVTFKASGNDVVIRATTTLERYNPEGALKGTKPVGPEWYQTFFTQLNLALLS